MSVWHTVTDSGAFRKFAKQSPARHFFRSGTFDRMNVGRNRVLTARATRRDPRRYDSVRTFCCFIGHNKSGTTMLGALLDAHPEIVLSDEIDALHYVDAGFTARQIFHLVDKGARAELRKGRVTARRLEPYSYLVPGQSQGRCEHPVVMGDSTSGTTTRRLATSPDLLDRLRATMDGIDVRLIQVIRNPFDPISVMMVRGKRSFENSIDHYFTACARLVQLRARLGPDALLPVRHEDFVAAPQRHLAATCTFLGVDAPADYLEACAAIIRPVPDRSRDMVTWTQPWIDTVERRIAEFDFLDGYSHAD